MNLHEEKYAKYTLIREMIDTIEVVKNFDPHQTKIIAKEIQEPAVCY